jgi:E3 ubiquitin-protein ligase RNF220
MAASVPAERMSCSDQRSNWRVEKIHRKRRSLDIPDDHAEGEDTREHNAASSTSALAAAPGAKRGASQFLVCEAQLTLLAPHPAKRAETRECPICRERIPLRLLAQHHTLEISRVQTILDHIGDLEGFSDPHAPAHAPYVISRLPHRNHAVPYTHLFTQSPHRSISRRRSAPHIRDTSAVSVLSLAKTLSAIKRRRKARHLALRAATRDEDDIPVAGKGKGRAIAAVQQCPVCMQDIEGDPDVITAHIDACLAHAELPRLDDSTDGDADGDTPLEIDGHAEGDDDLWEESETPDGVRLRAGIRSGASALGFAVCNPTVEDVEDEIDVEGDDLVAFGAAQFTEADVRAEGSDSKLSGCDTSRSASKVEADLAIERAGRSGDLQALVLAYGNKVQLLMVRPTPYFASMSLVYSRFRTTRPKAQRSGVAFVSSITANRQ